MFSLLFPGQGSQIVGMGKEFYENFDYVKDLFQNADEIFKKKISKIILEGPGELLNQTENTQTAIFLISFSIFQVLEKETNLNIKNAQFYAGHSLGEYSALCCAGSINFEQTINLLKSRGKAMQNAVPKGEGGMLAVLGSKVEIIEDLLSENKNNFIVQIANDNSEGQIVLSGRNSDIEKLIKVLKSKNIKNIKLPVSAPFHCELMRNEIQKLDFQESKNKLISNVTAKEILNKEELKMLLIDQIENRVRWRESVDHMISNGINHFIEIGPGKVLTGLIKRIDKNVKINTINTESDIKDLKL